MQIPINEIKRLIKNPNNDVGIMNAVYVTPAQQLRNRADAMEREERDYKIVCEWLHSLESDKTEQL
jgi:hypothetical protein